MSRNQFDIYGSIDDFQDVLTRRRLAKDRWGYGNQARVLNAFMCALLQLEIVEYNFETEIAENMDKFPTDRTTIKGFADTMIAAFTANPETFPANNAALIQDALTALIEKTDAETTLQTEIDELQEILLQVQNDQYDCEIDLSVICKKQLAIATDRDDQDVIAELLGWETYRPFLFYPPIAPVLSVCQDRGGGSLFLNWNRIYENTAGNTAAAYYIVKIDGEYRETTLKSQILIEGLPLGVELEISVYAVSEAGESEPGFATILLQ